MTRTEVEALALSFPGTERGASHGLPSFKAEGKVFTRIRDEDDSLVVHVHDFEHRDMPIEAEPETFHLTDHYRGRAIVLARIATVDAVWLKGALATRWRLIVPKRTSKAWDALQSGDADT